MQIFQWLFKANEQGSQDTTTSKDQEDKPKDIISFKKRSRSRSKSKKFKPIIFLCNKDIAKACFYSTIYLKKVHSSDRTHHQPHSQSMMKTKKEGLVVSQKPDSSKVLPLSVSPSSTNSSKEKKEDKLKGENKTKTMSRMKELLRWASSGKSEKGAGKLSQKIMNSKNRESFKTVVSSDDDRLSSNIESPKISFSTSFSSSSTSGISMTSSFRNEQISLNSTIIHGLNRCSSRRGNWITTDAEFVVLELSG